MSRFLVTYHGAGMPADPTQAQAAKAAFGQWLGQAGSAVVDPGAPVRPVAQVATGAASAEVPLGGYSIIEAASTEEAKRLLASHPFVARGGTLQVNEVMAVE